MENDNLNSNLMKINRKINIFNLIVFSITFLFAASCNKDNCLNSSGNVSKEIRNLEAFNTIDIYDCFNVYLKSDTITKIEIEAGNKVIPNIETTVADGVLTIKDLNKCGFLKGYADKNLYISVDTLSRVTINDASKLFTQDTLRVKDLIVLFISQLGSCDLTVDARTFDLGIWFGAGDYIVRGKCNYARLSAEEISFIYAEELDANSLYVQNNSMGDCYVHANGELSILIRDSGNIYYSGQPNQIIKIEESGSGKLIKK